MDKLKGLGAILNKPSFRNAALAIMAMLPLSVTDKPEPDRMVMEGNLRGENMLADEDGRVRAMDDSEAPFTAQRELALESAFEPTSKNRSALEDLLSERN